MIKKGTVIIVFVISGISIANSQSVTDQNLHKITMQDLKPRLNYADSSPFYAPLQEKSGLALMSSAIIPGSAQAANGKWIRAGAYLLAEAILMSIHFKSYHDAKVEQRRYHEFANNNWSVVTYARWLVGYHEQNNLENPYIEELRNQLVGQSASYNPHEDWQKVDIELLRKVEQNTHYVYPDHSVGSSFSHEMPDYGSQQYYELISKYYQFGIGWNDFGRDRNGNSLENKYRLNWNGSAMPFNFVQGAALSEDFNDSYRLAGNMVSLIILNHIVSAFDAFLTVKGKNNRLEAETDFLNPHRSVTLTYHF